ncbi:hypothetical protein B0H63DRAFT_472734 [Podospora didyma]|uniref:Uncharacterized protein n=1 Tax=Podospora didyma TaxID=330526 RepID=A0AAE0TZG3_9PEZI|nr:hypothetical protein B0H63DRAFT_472734 [Podospora didyma]
MGPGGTTGGALSALDILNQFGNDPMDHHHPGMHHNWEQFKKRIVLKWGDPATVPRDFNPFEMDDIKAAKGTLTEPDSDDSRDDLTPSAFPFSLPTRCSLRVSDADDDVTYPRIYSDVHGFDFEGIIRPNHGRAADQLQSAGLVWILLNTASVMCIVMSATWVPGVVVR